MSADRNAEDRAWESYWRENPGRGCVPDAAGIAAVLEERWSDFARALPTGTSVIDLGSGAGAVLGMLGAARPDLELVGVDSVPSLPGTKAADLVRTGVAMEDLPFPNASFGAACSQFGFEYGRMEKSAVELARVLQPGSPVRLILHHRGGPVAKQGESRLRALLWAVEENDFFSMAERVAEARSAARLPTPPGIPQAIGEARRRFPGEPVAADVLAALHAILVEGETRPLDSASQVRNLRQRAGNEVTTLTALGRAAQDRAGIDNVAQLLEAAGIAAAAPVALVEPQRGLAFAWLLDGTRG